MQVRLHLRSGGRVEVDLDEPADDLDEDEVGTWLRAQLTDQTSIHGFVVLGDTPVHQNAIEAIEPL